MLGFGDLQIRVKGGIRGVDAGIGKYCICPALNAGILRQREQTGPGTVRHIGLI